MSALISRTILSRIAVQSLASPAACADEAEIASARHQSKTRQGPTDDESNAMEWTSFHTGRGIMRPTGPITKNVMIITTTPTVEGKRIVKYLGIVAGEAILGANIFRDMFARVRDIVGGRSAAYERELGRAREIALDEMEDWAEELGANAIVGVDIDYESFGQTNGMMMVSVSGTAVTVQDI